MGNEEKLDVRSWPEKVNKLLTYVIMSDSLLLACVQFLIMMIVT